jgi:hypothetical protein
LARFLSQLGILKIEGKIQKGRHFGGLFPLERRQADATADREPNLQKLASSAPGFRRPYLRTPVRRRPLFCHTHKHQCSTHNHECCTHNRECRIDNYQCRTHNHEPSALSSIIATVRNRECSIHNCERSALASAT